MIYYVMGVFVVWEVLLIGVLFVMMVFVLFFYCFVLDFGG